MQNNWTTRGLWTLSTLLLLGSAAAVTWGIAGKLDPDTPSTSPQALAPVVAPPSTAPAAAPLAQFDPVAHRDIRQPLDGTAVTSTPGIPLAGDSPISSMKLVATAIDSDRPCAVFLDPQQHVFVRTLGQLIEGMTVIAIQRQKVTLQQQGRQFELAVPEQFTASDGVLAPASAPPSGGYQTPPSRDTPRSGRTQ